MMEPRKVLIALNESQVSDKTFNFYMKYGHKSNDQILLLYVPEYHTVIQSPMVMTDVNAVQGLLHEEENRIKAFLEKLGNKLKTAQVGGKVRSVGGNPGEVICKVASKEKYDLIVTGCRGTSRRSLAGSVSDYVMHRAPVPVLICKNEEDDKS